MVRSSGQIAALNPVTLAIVLYFSLRSEVLWSQDS